MRESVEKSKELVSKAERETQASAHKKDSSIQLLERLNKEAASYSMQQYALKFGYCTESWWFDDLIADVYFGVGLGETTTHGYEVVKNALALTTKTEQKPALYLGVKIGFVF